MNLRKGTTLALACVALLFSAMQAAAKEKQQPAPQWALDAAKTPTPSNVADAPAVVLFDEYLITIDDQNHAVERERFAVRILKPQGRKYAHCEAEYDNDSKLNYFHSWTIAADGKQFAALDTDYKDAGANIYADMQFSDRFRVVNPPGDDPGAVVVCETESHLRPYMDSENWQIQAPIPVVDEALELALPIGGHYADAWSKFPPIKPVELESNHLRWELKNVPALDLENLHATPPWEALAARMAVMWGDAAVNGTANQWRAIGQWQDQLEQHRPDPSPEITAKAQELAAGVPDLYTKLSRITSYIQKNIRYFVVEKGIGGWQAHPAADIFRNRYGDCKDKTTLLISMLEVIGVHAHYLAVDSERGVIDPGTPSIYGNHMITAIELPDNEHDPRLMATVKAVNGKTLLIFDPTDEATPVGLIRGELQGAYGSMSNGSDSQVLAMPVISPQSAGLSRQASFVLSPDGSVSGKITSVFSGGEAANERMVLKEADQKEIHDGLEEALDRDMPSLTFKGYEFHKADDLDQPVTLDLYLSAEGYAHASGSLLLLRPRLTGTNAREVPDVMESKTRKYPIEIGHPGRWRDTFDITLPAGYVVDETPDPVDVDVNFASYHASVTAKGNVLHYEREYIVRQVEIPPDKAEDFRKLEGAILFDEKGTAVLKKQ